MRFRGSILLKTGDQEQKENAKQFPQFFYARHMQNGLCGYGDEIVLVETDTIKRMLPTLKGKPIYVNHQKVDLPNLKEQAQGYITKSFYNEADGCAWVEMLVTDDDAMQAIANGWKVSNAYIPTRDGKGGEFHNIKFNRRIVDGEFTHLAIVPNPRYEEAEIMTPAQFRSYNDRKRAELSELQNSKPEKGNPMLKFFKTKKEETNEIDLDTQVEMQNEAGETVTVTVGEMAKAFEEKEAAKVQAEEKKNAKTVDENTTVEVSGKQVKIADLKAAFLEKQNAKCNKKNSDEETEESEEEVENDDSEEEEKEEEKANSKSSKTDHFKELQNANKQKTNAPLLEIGMDKIARGQSRYGSGN